MSLLILGTLVLLLAASQAARPCSEIHRELRLPCNCDVLLPQPGDAGPGLAMNCDHVVFSGDFPTLPYRAPIVAFRQRHAGHQALPTQAFASAALPLRTLDFSNNLLRRLTDRLLQGLQDTLQELLLADNLLGDNLNPIFSSSEFHGLGQLRVLDLSGNLIKGIEEGILKGCASLQELRLDRNSLPDVPSASLNGPRALKVLSLTHNRIGLLLSGAFSSQHSLERIDVSNNLLVTVEGGAFSGLGRLRKLRLARNKLTRFNSDVFQGAENLDHLDLSENFLTEVPSVALKVFTSLKHLNLSSNSIKSLEGANLGAQPDLQQLDLSRNGLATVTPGAFLGLRQLRVLDLSVNSLRTVDDDVFEGLENLEYLSLLDNNVLLVPASALGHLPKLALLQMDYNRIAALSGDILRSVADRIQSLSLARNVVRELPANSFQEFKQLVSLDLSGNLLLNVAAATFSGLEGTLVELKLGQNRITALTGTPISLPELKLLDLSRNQLNEVSRTAFSMLPSLLHLNLSYNPQLALLPTSVLHSLPHLAILDMSVTGLKQLPQEFFQHNTALEEVYLRGNSIQEITDGAFHNLQNLTSIDLSDNHILNIRPGAFSGLISIKRVLLKGNRLSAFKGEFFKPPRGSDINSGTSLEELDLSDNELSYLFPSSFRIHPRIRHLAIANNRFSFFPAELIASLQFLEYVDLSGNDLKSVEELDFARLPRLRILLLSRNQIEAVSESAFHNSTQLQVLDLSSNKLERLGERTFEGLARIEMLNLENNILAELPDSIFERSRLQMLENINLARNKFEIPPLKTLQRQYFFLSSVDLSRNLLHEIPPEDSIMVNIKKLDLSFNPLSEQAIANVLGEPKTVRELNLAGTGIVKVTQLETPFLHVLNLSHNGIVELPDKVFERSTLLEALDLSHNKISDLSANLPRVWSRLKNLRALDLSGNPVTGIMAGDFDGLESLQSLKISNLEQCMRMEKNAFKPLGNLVELVAYGYPRLGYLDAPGILQNLPVLETLDLEMKDAAVSSEQLATVLHARMTELSIRGPRVRSISSGALAGLKSSSVCVGLRNTSLASLPPALFFPVPRSTVIRLDITGSHLTTLSPQLLAALDERRGDITLHGLASNPILCDCSARALRRWLPGAGMAGIKCTAPESLAGKLLVEIADDELTCDPNRQTTTTSTTAMSSPSTRASKVTTEPDIIWSTPPSSKDKILSTKPNGAGNKVSPTTGASSPNNDDTLIIGIVGGVVAFIIILIIIICIIRLRITNNQYRGGPLAAGPAPSLLTGSNCTCVKPPPGPPLYMAPYAPGYAATLPPKLSSVSSQAMRPTYATMGRQPYYQNPPYYITYPAEEKDHR
ncbi:chaoptin [Anabrus simplex]|uniref:chaoptin n=1 Tax=Anabrus simplex TaxID=316456 RepID=UPI0035A309A4